MTRIGEIAVHRIVESICREFAALDFFPGTTPADWEEHRDWMAPRAYDPATGKLILTIQGFLLRTRHHTIVVDTCVGDHKPREARPFWHMLKLNTFLPRLAAAGVRPEEVDFVMCTHLHWDHVGWNTRLQDGRWVPTFPNAKYIFARREWESFEEFHRRTPQPHYADSLLPIVEAGQAQFVDMDFALDDEVRLEPTPGHTPGHVAVQLNSRNQKAVITGDCIHSPVQCLKPGWRMRADSDHELAGTTRRQFLERYCENRAMVCATHFPEPSIGRVVRRGDAFWFDDGTS
ncbi:MAG TPA: MBL fold metallo-hydrolase [Burkholderiales bacterium]|nr:MBL fold metallo-hydrolase [Burkholderiales bacterium]